jgi:hypothetical protein
VERAQLARIVNAKISELADRLETRSDAAPLGFLCECGCWELVEISAAEYERKGGALIPGHTPPPSD